MLFDMVRWHVMLFADFEVTGAESFWVLVASKLKKWVYVSGFKMSKLKARELL